MSEQLQGRKAGDDEIEEVAAIAEPFIEAFQALPGQLGLHALCYTAAAIVMGAHTTIPKVDAWDHVAATIRKTIEENVRLRTPACPGPYGWCVYANLCAADDCQEQHERMKS